MRRSAALVISLNDAINLPSEISTLSTSEKIRGVVPELDVRDADGLVDAMASTTPFVVRGYVDDWPIVLAGNKSFKDLKDHILGFYEGMKCNIFRGNQAGQHHVFYDENMKLNFESTYEDLEEILDEMAAASSQTPQPLMYSGSIPTRKNLPGFEAANALRIGERKMMCSLWMGTRSRVPIHSDYLDNFACVAAGRRHVTLFPPEQFKNLYIGPLHYTPASRPVSLVDLADPDFEKFPLFEEALSSALQITLEPGDILHIPSMWWHHIEGFSNFNVLVNFWWNEEKPALGSPELAMWHAIYAVRDLSPERKNFWLDMFNHYVFNADQKNFDHIENESQGVLKELDERAAGFVRNHLIRELSK